MMKRKLISVILLGLAVWVSAACGGMLPQERVAQAPTLPTPWPTPEVWVRPEISARWERLDQAGKNFVPGATIELHFVQPDGREYQPYPTAIADGSGRFSHDYAVPDDAAPGWYQFYAVESPDKAARQSNTALYYISNPKVEVVMRNEGVELYGSGFMPQTEEGVKVSCFSRGKLISKLGEPDNAEYLRHEIVGEAIVQVNEYGEFSVVCQPLCSSDSKYTYTQFEYVVEELHSGERQAGTLANACPQVWVNPASSRAGDRLDQSGTGFTPNSTVELHFIGPDGTGYEPYPTEPVQADGTFAHFYDVPANIAPGWYYYYALDSSNKRSNIVRYWIGNPRVDVVGLEGKVELRGSGFAPQEANITIECAVIGIPVLEQPAGQDEQEYRDIARTTISADNQGNFIYPCAPACFNENERSFIGFQYAVRSASSGFEQASESWNICPKKFVGLDEPPTVTPAPPPQPAAGAVRINPTDGTEMVYVPAGEFTMGSENGGDDEKPVHTVYLDAYWIDRYEVTNAQFRKCVEAGVCRAPTTCDWGRPTYQSSDKASHPVVCVDWENARQYCEWAGNRLPTEAEWEKAARGADERVYPWGDEFDSNKVNFCDKNCEYRHKNHAYDDGYARTAPVGSYPAGASPYGAQDMAGNVWEWCADWSGEDSYASSPSRNPQGPNSGETRIVRGGSWVDAYSNTNSNVRSAARFSDFPNATSGHTGFRCAVSAESP